MIRYSLKCANDHVFESWFQSASAFDKLHEAGMVSCSVCNSADVSKSVMTPSVKTSRTSRAGETTAPQAGAAQGAPTAQTEKPSPSAMSLRTPSSPTEAVLSKLRAHIERTSEHVGKDFATESRRIHHGEAPERPIYGEAKPEEAKSLIEEGISVLPLPFMPTRETN